MSTRNRTVTTSTVAFLPPAPILLPAYASTADPGQELREACLDAVSRLVEDRPLRVLVLGEPADPDNLRRGVRSSLATRVARSLLDTVGYAGELVSRTPDATEGLVLSGEPCLVLANGSARRHEQGPGHLDERAFAFDQSVVKALCSGTGADLGALDDVLGAELLASGTDVLRWVGAELHAGFETTVRYLDDPFGVQYWVVTWTPAAERGRLIQSNRSVNLARQETR